MCQNQSEKSSKTANLHFDCTVIEIIKQQKKKTTELFPIFESGVLQSRDNFTEKYNLLRKMHNKESTGEILWLAFDTINYRLPMKRLGIYNISLMG